MRSNSYEAPPQKVDEVRGNFFIDLTSLIEHLENKLDLKGHFKNEPGETERKRKAIEITYAYLIQFILYKVLADNAIGDFGADWTVRRKAIDKALETKTHAHVLSVIKGISEKISDRIYKKFSDDQSIIDEKLKELLCAPDSGLEKVSPWLDIILFIGRYDFANVRNEVFGHVYENYLKDLYLDEKKGQYFTDPRIVEFMLNEIGYTKEDLRKRYSQDKDSLSIIDPACGSGAFLYGATQRLAESFFDESGRSPKDKGQLINDNVFGLDIAEFPVYLAEMNILMRMVGAIANERYNDPADQRIKVFRTRDSMAEFLDTDLRNTASEKGAAREKAGTGFDFVIGNPPYISYNECASQKMPFFELLREKKTKLSNVYGVNLHSVRANRKKYPPKPNLYAFFTALGLGLLKDQGKLCYILPQTLITESDYDVLRWHLAKFTTIEKIFFFGKPLFSNRGINLNNTVATSSLIIVLNKSLPIDSHAVKIVNYANSSPKKKCKQYEIQQTILLKNYLNWIVLKLDDEAFEIVDEYRSANESLNYYSEHALARERFKSEFYFDVGFILDRSKILPHPVEGNEFELIDLKNFRGYTLFQPAAYYPADLSLIKLPRNSQGYDPLSKKYKIVWGKAYSSQFYFTDRKVLPSMSYTQFISSNNKEELLYLFALLNSKTNNYIFHSLFQLGNEKIGIFVVVKRIKEFLKIPFIDQANRRVKKAVIAASLELIETERSSPVDLADRHRALLKEYIDDLVYALYFKVSLPDPDFAARTRIKKVCAAHKYYQVINKPLLIPSLSSSYGIPGLGSPNLRSFNDPLHQ